jgi:simple sugar transport system permease protein
LLILTLLCSDSAVFLGVLSWPLRPGALYVNIQSSARSSSARFCSGRTFLLSGLPGDHFAWFWFSTKPGLALRSVGERPETAFVRGVRVNLTRYLYTAVGGALVGMGGAAYTLSVKSKWLENDIVGNGWIALAIVIFGGWYPLRIALGVYLVAGLRTVVLALQSSTERG